MVKLIKAEMIGTQYDASSKSSQDINDHLHDVEEAYKFLIGKMQELNEENKTLKELESDLKNREDEIKLQEDEIGGKLEEANQERDKANKERDKIEEELTSLRKQTHDENDEIITKATAEAKKIVEDARNHRDKVINDLQKEYEEFAEAFENEKSKAEDLLTAIETFKNISNATHNSEHFKTLSDIIYENDELDDELDRPQANYVVEIDENEDEKETSFEGLQLESESDDEKENKSRDENEDNKIDASDLGFNF